MVTLWSCEDMKAQFQLYGPDHETFIKILSTLPLDIIHEIGSYSIKPWSKYWWWYPDTTIFNYKP